MSSSDSPIIVEKSDSDQPRSDPPLTQGGVGDRDPSPIPSSSSIVIVEPSDRGSGSARKSNVDKRGKWWFLNVLLPLLILAAGVGIIFAFGKVEPSQRPPVDRSKLGILKSLPPVRTVAVESLQSSGRRLRLQADGEVVPFREAEVAAEVAGRIIYKSDQCEAGQFVQEGDELMQIDRTDMELEVERLSRSQEQSYEAIKEIDQELVNTDRLIEVAKRDVQLQIRDVRRQRSLPDGFNTGREIDSAEKALLIAEQALLTLENRISSLKAQRAKLEAAERLAAAQLRSAEVNLQRTKIVAPIDGVIVRESVDVNSFVARGTSLVTIETTDKVEVDSKLRSDQLYWVLNQAGSGSSAVPDADGNPTSAGRLANYKIPETPAIISYELSGLENQVYRWRGRLVSYDGIGLDPQTRTTPVRILVDDPQQNVDVDGNPIESPGSPALVRGMFVSISLQIKPTTNLMVVPATAMQPGNRVLQFVPDDSVLEPPLQQDVSDGSDGDDATGITASPTTPKSGSNSEEEMVDEVPESFDPDQWIAGRIELQTNIVPIDSLSMDQMKSDDSRRSWVCEVPPQTLVDGSMVIVSPVGNFDGTSMPARASVASDTESAQ